MAASQLGNRRRRGGKAIGRGVSPGKALVEGLFLRDQLCAAPKRNCAASPPAPWHIGIAPNGRSSTFATPDDSANRRSRVIDLIGYSPGSQEA